MTLPSACLEGCIENMTLDLQKESWKDSTTLDNILVEMQCWLLLFKLPLIQLHATIIGTSWPWVLKV